jgi:tRNA-uridine 2-sulfurtransferase
MDIPGDILARLPQPIPQSCVVGLSGGVDSGMSLALLRAAGCKVVGLYIALLPKDECDPQGCCGFEAMQAAKTLCQQLDVPFYIANGRRSFVRDIVEPYRLKLHQAVVGSPCPACNAQIKLPILRRRAAALGINTVATGHYARVVNYGQRKAPARGGDPGKDQSYMLFRLSQSDLANLYLSLGDFHKSEVVKLAEEMGLPGVGRAESQDLCFVQGKLWQWAGHGEPGDIMTTEGKVVGQHQGLTGIAVGQRRRLGVAIGERAYVTGIDVEKNRLIIGSRVETMKRTLWIDDLAWSGMAPQHEPFNAQVELRYRTKPIVCRTIPLEKDEIRLELEEAYQGPSPGQQAVLYNNDIVLGGGTIYKSL